MMLNLLSRLSTGQRFVRSLEANGLAKLKRLLKFNSPIDYGIGGNFPTGSKWEII